MGWRGAVRSINAASRRAQRDAARRTRERARHIAALEKEQAREEAANAVQDYEEYVASLVTLHRTCSPPANWSVRASKAAPPSPFPDKCIELTARQALTNYKPSWWAKLTGQAEKEKHRLEKAVDDAPAADQRAYEAAVAAYRQALEDHEDEVTFASKVIRHDEAAMLEAVKLFEPLASIDLLGENLMVRSLNPKRIGVTLSLHGEEIIPKDRPKLLASGRASVKPMPKGDYHRLYQDHACSACLRVAREILALLPIDEVLVTAVDDLVDTTIGHLQQTPVLSFLAPRTTMLRMNFNTLDPSDAMKNFIHNMKFSPTAGLTAVQPVEVPA